MNRQRYMAELSKLLAFMFKEDKEDILAQYNKMLDEAEDEQAMLESFGSPTRLAVTISRTYKRSERKLSVEADSKDDGSTGESAMPFAPAAAKVKEPKSAPEETTLSYADIIEEIRREKAQEEGIEYKPIFFNEPEPEPMPETPAVEEQPPAEETVSETPAETEAPAEAETTDEQPEETAAEEETPEEAAPETVEEAPETEKQPEKDEQIEAEAPAEDEAPVEAESDSALDEPSEETSEEEPEEEESPEDESEEIFAELDEIEQPEEETRYKTNVALLILYLIFAIPVGVVLVAAAIVLGLLLLAFGAGLIASALKIAGFAFSMFNIFADIMLCAGASLIAFAVALVIIWLGIIMFAKAIGGIVRGLKALGRSICVKEVSVNE